MILLALLWYFCPQVLAFTVSCNTDFQALNHSITKLFCPPNCWKRRSNLCGSGVYAKGPICLAAMQEQLIDASGGLLTVYESSKPATFSSTVQNGVASQTCTHAGPTAYTFEMTCTTKGNTQYAITKVYCPANCQGQTYPCGNRAFHLNSSVCAVAMKTGKLIASGGEVTIYKYTNGSNILIPAGGNNFCGSSSWFVLTDVNPCLVASPCLNGGTCVDLLGDFACICASAFTGKTCETGMGCPKSKLVFSHNKQIVDYAWFQGHVPRFVSATACMWMNVSTYSHDLTTASYAVPGKDNDFLLYFYGKDAGKVVEFWVSQTYTFLNVSIPLKTNVHLCVWFDTTKNLAGTYSNANKTDEKTFNISPTTANGSFIIGQEQDAVNAGRLDPAQSFLGTVSDFVMWPRVLTSSEINVIYRTCNCPKDYVISMAPSKIRLYGNVTNLVNETCSRA